MRLARAVHWWSADGEQELTAPGTGIPRRQHRGRAGAAGRARSRAPARQLPVPGLLIRWRSAPMARRWPSLLPGGDVGIGAPNSTSIRRGRSRYTSPNAAAAGPVPDPRHPAEHPRPVRRRRQHVIDRRAGRSRRTRRRGSAVKESTPHRHGPRAGLAGGGEPPAGTLNSWHRLAGGSGCRATPAAGAARDEVTRAQRLSDPTDVVAVGRDLRLAARPGLAHQAQVRRRQDRAASRRGGGGLSPACALG